MTAEYSLAFLPLILVIAFGFVYFAYFFKQKNTAPFTLKQRILLSVLRFFGVFLILLLFLSPYKNITTRIIEKPLIILAQDNSQSIDKTKDSVFYRTKLLKTEDKIYNDLSKDYNIVKIVFSDEAVQLDSQTKFEDTVRFSGFATDIAGLFDFIEGNFSSENLSAVILSTDGISTFGNNVLNYADKITYPVYTVALGDTTVNRDVYISDIQYNKTVFLDNEYPVEITVKADKAKNKTVSLYMTSNSKTVLLETVNINSDDYTKTVSLKNIAKKEGIEKLSFYLTETEGESNTMNNKRDIFVEVLNSKKQILILSSSPNADVSALKTAIESSNNYTCKAEIFSSFDGNVKDFDLIILHGLPDGRLSFNAIEQWVNKDKKPLMFIVGQGTDIAMFNALKLGVSLTGISSSFNLSTPIVNNSFSPFMVTEDLKELVNYLPPVLTPVVKYNYSSSLNILMYQKIGNVSTSYPLIAFNTDRDNICGFIFGENIWRWRLYDYKKNENFDLTDGLILKTVRLLCLNEKKSKFRVENKDIYSQSEKVIFKAQLYNDNYETVEQADVSLTVKSSDGQKTYSFLQNNNEYYLNLGYLSEGEYSFTAKAVYDNKTYEKKGFFSVSQIYDEILMLKARHDILYTLSKKTDGRMLYPKDLNSDNLMKILKNNETVKPIIKEHKTNKKFISVWQYWLLIILSLGGEWFLRKYFGKI